MLYRAIGLMSGSSLDGLDIAYVEFLENGGKWSYEIVQADCYPYSAEWTARLKNAVFLSALDYQLLHSEYGHYLGQEVNRFIEKNQLQYKVALVASHGHTSFHQPAQKMTAQLGDGSAIAAETQLPVVSDLRSLDLAFGGQGAPIVPIGERLLLPGYNYFLNLGGIANISVNAAPYIAFDICPANRVLNMLALDAGKEYDEGGQLAASGSLANHLLEQLNALDYYQQKGPKSLANSFGTDTVYPLVKKAALSIPDALRTYTEHIVSQLVKAITELKKEQAITGMPEQLREKLLVTGGGALNTFLVKRLQEELTTLNIDLVIPEEKLVQFKEALIMALIGVLRWREETNTLSSVTGAKRDSVGGAMWMGQEG